MGVFKSMRDLQKQAKDIERSMPPYPATTQQRVSQMQIGRLQPGLTLQASVDPSNPAAIWLDLESLR